VIIPCLPYFGGNCQDAAILVDNVAATVKLPGAWEGTEITQGKC